jgi:hypothetical protein
MQTASIQQFTPLELETRPTVDTAAYAHYMHIATQTARIHACKESGPIRPIRIPGTAKLHWPVAEIRRVLGVTPHQKGFSTLGYLAFIIVAALLVQIVLMMFPGFIASLDWAGVAMLGAGVIGGCEYNDLSALADAAKTHGYTVHLHHDEMGCPVFSVGNSNTGAREFANFDAAMKFVSTEPKKHKRPEPERPFIGSLGDCLAQTANYKPLGYAKITEVGHDALRLHLEATTAAMFEASVTIFIRAGVTPEYAREVLKEAARCLKGYDTLEPWTPQEFLKSTPFDDGENVPF